MYIKFFEDKLRAAEYYLQKAEETGNVQQIAEMSTKAAAYRWALAKAMEDRDE